MVPVAVIVASHMPSNDGRGDEGSGTIHDTATAEADLVRFLRAHLRIWLTAPLMPIATLRHRQGCMKLIDATRGPARQMIRAISCWKNIHMSM
jgi:hypothetical protein